jgi:hypothetical protein
MKTREELAERFWHNWTLARVTAKKHLIETHKCNTHPSAPHGFLRNASHNAGRYVCECEHWKGSE